MSVGGINLFHNLARIVAAAVVGLAEISLATAALSQIAIPSGSPFPEGLTATKDGTLYASSLTNGGIVRAKPGASEAEVWIEPGTFGTRSTFGVLADENAGLLWVCSNDPTPLGVKGPNTIEGSFVKGFDLETGKGRISAQLPTQPSICNDLAVGPDGALYVTNTLQPQILRLKKGSSELEVWVQDGKLKGGLDGIAFGQDGALYVNTFQSGEVFRIESNMGVAGVITKLETSRPIKFPDGLRADKTGFLMVEGAGPLSKVTIVGDRAEIDTIKDFAGPTALARIGNTLWIAEGQIGYLMDPSKKGQTPTFQLRSIDAP
ncbi:SMP-30/gluconolactonase/LRE family protein [Bradyrhizobium vignae]|uniref:SMP-30/Gluconolactonase/LRE-like region domain-containing protein n=1 Tax=Bradyrhizobium vignae TaxID=1549949 RepID=A0A2U3PUI4_9BRAD|nr:hypothetical protein [Bradyrhizobium vignae]SPP92815.1 conserved protein of unknown function [Bradyrhizobium vignae]